MSEALTGLVVVLDEAPFDDLIGAVEVIVQQGIGAIAFHAGTQDLSTWVSIYGERVRVGVHRVTSDEQMRRAVEAGVTFALPDIVSPDIIAAAGQLAIYPPAMTPTEIRSVLALPVTGAQIVPAEVLGSSYAETVRDLGLVERCLPRGIGAYAAGRWFETGARAAIVDGELLGDALSGGDLENLRDRCLSFLQALRHG